jgi:hypothetical protein
MRIRSGLPEIAFSTASCPLAASSTTVSIKLWYYARKFA